MSDCEVEAIDATTRMEAVDAILTSDSTSYNTAIEMKITYSRVRQWVYRGRKRKRLFERGGRPNALDDQSMRTIQQFLLKNPEVTDVELKAKIKEEHVVTHKRKFLLLDDDVSSDSGKIRKLSRPTVQKYLRLLR